MGSQKHQDGSDNFGRESVLDVMLKPLVSVQNFVDELVANDPTLSSDQPFMNCLWRWLTLPFRLMLGFFLFIIQAWTSTRSGFAFLRAIPAMTILFGFFAALLIADMVNTEGRMLGANQGYINYHNKEYPEHPEYAVAFAEKLVEIKPDEDSFKYKLGLAKEAAGEVDAALNVMTSIAPEEQTGFDMGHIWLAAYYLRSQLLDLDEEAKSAMVTKHLSFAVEAKANNLNANYQLARIYMDKAEEFAKGSPKYLENRAQAKKYYDVLLDGPIRYRYQLRAIPTMIELQLELGDENLARNRSLEWINELRLNAENQPDNIDLWYSMIRCSLILDDYGRAEKIAKDALDLVRNIESKRAVYQIASMIGEQRADDFIDMNLERDYAYRLRSLCQAVTNNPLKKSLYNKLLEFVSIETRDGTETADGSKVVWPSEINELWLRNAVIGGDSSGVVHGLVGVLEISKGNIVEGEKHWRLADGQLKGVVRVIDMLIRVAVEDHQGKLNNAFEMINLAIELFPESPELYQTRGIYFEKRQQYEKAVADFTYVSEKRPDNVLLHKILIRCHEKLGDSEKVMHHKIQLETKLTEMGKEERKQMERTLERFDSLN
ncbi:MAG: hypothetical protein AB8B55_11260 [Mariniblastus sp.]